MHLIGLLAVVLIWGVGMIVRPAATLFLTTLVVGVVVMAAYNFSPHH